jgi:SPP1 gp7 family putative phage head morphogenesis protein
VRRTLAATLAENVSLIRSLDDQMRTGVAGAVFRGLQNRSPARDVAREIRALTGVGTRRAELIAADQLQKLTSLLDEERQKQAGMGKFQWAHSRKKYPRPEHIVRDGKVYEWSSSVAKNDPPGRAIRCGCKARGVLEVDEEAEVTPAPTPAPAPPPEPPPAPVARRGFRSPINAAVTAETIKVGGRLALQKTLGKEFAEANTEPRYSQRNEFRGRGTDFGKAQFAAQFDDETVSMLAALKPELDNLADQIGIPRLRGMRSVSGSSAMANQGDGVMGINPGYFHGFAEKVGGRESGSAGDIEAKRAAIAEQMAPMVAEIKEIRAKIVALSMNDPEYAALKAREDEIFRQYNKLRTQDDKLWREGNKAKHATAGDVSRWRRGDVVKERPFGADRYFEGVDRARTVLFHEFGHHVHQYINKAGPRSAVGKPPLERDLYNRWRGSAAAGRYDRQASQYATTNEHEWWAENFALFVMGRRDLVDPQLTDLIESMFDGTY